MLTSEEKLVLPAYLFESSQFHLSKRRLSPKNRSAIIENRTRPWPYRKLICRALLRVHALALDLILVTANVKEFSRVPDLRIENWLDI